MKNNITLDKIFIINGIIFLVTFIIFIFFFYPPSSDQYSIFGILIALIGSLLVSFFTLGASLILYFYDKIHKRSIGGDGKC